MNDFAKLPTIALDRIWKSLSMRDSLGLLDARGEAELNAVLDEFERRARDEERRLNHSDCYADPCAPISNYSEYWPV